MSGAPGSRAGSTFGPYQLKRPLGRGGMGEVYEAEHTVKGWTVALKLMSESVSSDPVFRERMKREARITGRLQEPHVVPIHDYGEIDGPMFLEMRLIEGTDLDSVLKRFGPLIPAACGGHHHPNRLRPRRRPRRRGDASRRQTAQHPGHP
jgi:serine/threonine kinase PknH